MASSIGYELCWMSDGAFPRWRDESRLLGWLVGRSRRDQVVKYKRQVEQGGDRLEEIYVVRGQQFIIKNGKLQEVIKSLKVSASHLREEFVIQVYDRHVLGEIRSLRGKSGR